MVFIKGIKSRLKLLYFLCFLLLSSCNVYNTLRVDNINNESLALLYVQQRTVVIHNNREKNEFLLIDLQINNDSLKGEIINAPTGKTHPSHEKYFSANKVKAYNPLSVMHIYTYVNTINTGYFEIPLSSIRFVEIHEVNRGKSLSRTFIPIGIGVLVVIFITIIS